MDRDIVFENRSSRPQIQRRTQGPEGAVRPGQVIRSAKRLMRKRFVPLRFAVEGLMPTGMTVIASPPKAGKSWLALEISQAIIAGTPVLGRQADLRGSVLLFALEDSERRLQARLRKFNEAGASDKLCYITAESSPANGMGLIETWLADTPDAAAIIIDVYQKFQPGPDFQRGSYSADYTLVGALARLAQKYDIALIVMHHLNKVVRGDVMMAVKGSVAVVGAADTVIMLTRRSGQILMHAEGREIEPATLSLTFDAESCRFKVNPAQSDTHPVGRREQVFKLATAKPEITALDVEQHLEITNAAARRLLCDMSRDGSLTRIANGKYRPAGQV